MSRRAWLYGLGFAAVLWAVVVLAIIFWNYIMVGVVGLVAWRILMRGGRRRPRATFARNVTAVSAAVVAWQSRWLRPSKRTVRASVPASAAPVLDHQDGWGDVPY